VLWRLIEKETLDGKFSYCSGGIMKFLLNKIKEHDSNTYTHSLRVAELALEIARYLGLNDHDQKTIHMGGLLHDIGKLEVDPFILNKPNKLTLEEWDLIKKHPIFGYQMLQASGFDMGFSYISLFHHERCDGSGYPFGLKEEAIPLIAQVVALADCFDAMVTQRPYGLPKSIPLALNELITAKGSLFLPEVVDALVESIKNQNRRK
jgi:putative nucleotidyltransferase with HDIG domain